MIRQNPQLINLLITCQQLEAWLATAPEFQKWPAAQSYLKQLQEAVDPFCCSECGNTLPDNGPCWHNLFEEEAPNNIPFRGEAFPPKVYSEFEEYF